jgi:hypothetical protein
MGHKPRRIAMNFHDRLDFTIAEFYSIRFFLPEGTLNACLAPSLCAGWQ